MEVGLSASFLGKLLQRQNSSRTPKTRRAAEPVRIDGVDLDVGIVEISNGLFPTELIYIPDLRWRKTPG